MPNPSVPGWTFTRRPRRRTLESNEMSVDDDLCLPLPSPENKQRRLSYLQPVVGTPKQSADTSRSKAGITVTKMTFTRLIFSWTRLLFERSNKNICRILIEGKRPSK